MAAAIATLTLTAIGAAGCFLDEAPPKPVSNWTIGEARAFDEFDLHWLGVRYQALRLTSMRVTTDGDGVTHASFFYGKPVLAGDSGGSWFPPLGVNIQPYCGFNPEEARNAYGDDFRPLEIGEALGFLYEDFGLFLWTGDSTIALHRWKSDVDLEQAARDLIPIAEQTGATPQPLPPPPPTEC